MQFKGTITSAGLVYLPKEVREYLGRSVVLVPNSKSILIFRYGEDLSLVRRSLEIILADLNLQIDTEQHPEDEEQKKSQPREGLA